MKISLIAAMGEKRGIGKNNQLLFKISQDLKRFKQITLGHPVIMGRKTYESIGRRLPNRTNIIVSRDPEYVMYEAKVAHSLEEAIAIAKEAEKERLATGVAEKGDTGEIFIIGGGQIFAQAIDLADRLYLTIVEGEHDADTFFPDYAMFKKVVSEQKGQDGGYSFTFFDLER